MPTEPRAAPVEDIRSARPYLLSRSTLLAVGRRLASVAALVTLDLAGLVLGVWVALIFRELYLGDWPPLWGIIWETESEWLPFLTVITVLVFWVGGLYRRRELRAGVGQIVLSMVLVGGITLAFGLGTGYHFTTYGLAPTAVVTTAFFIGILRASYEVLTRDVLRLSGARRRTVLVGEGNSWLPCATHSVRTEAAFATSSSARSLRAAMPATSRCWAASMRCHAFSASTTFTSSS